MVTVLSGGEARRALDSRLSTICSTPPGTARTGPTLPANSEIFELRNAGNIVPPYGSPGVSGEAATIEYALEVLGVVDCW